MNLTDLLQDEELRCHEFPVAGEKAFFAHAAVSALPRRAEEAIRDFAYHGARDDQEGAWAWPKIQEMRQAGARLLGCEQEEVALLGPTSLGLNLIANGIEWKDGDEIVCYQDDYPANVYPWVKLSDQGVKPVKLQPEYPGAITWERVEAAVTERTRMVALATCNFLSGYRIDIDRIGKNLQDRGILFCLDGIQTLGAFPLSVKYVDFLSADSHKWMLGPVGAGIFYVKRERQDELKPTLLGAWNVVSPEYIAQDEINFYKSARRYEPGTLNMPGVVGMLGSVQLLLEIGVENIAQRILDLRRHLLDQVRPLGFRLLTEELDQESATTDDVRTGILSLMHPDRDLKPLFKELASNHVTVSLRQNRAKQPFLRFSPHFYNTEQEIDRAVALLKS